MRGNPTWNKDSDEGGGNERGQEKEKLWKENATTKWKTTFVVVVIIHHRNDHERERIVACGSITTDCQWAREEKWNFFPSFKEIRVRVFVIGENKYVKPKFTHVLMDSISSNRSRREKVKKEKDEHRKEQMCWRQREQKWTPWVSGFFSSNHTHTFHYDWQLFFSTWNERRRPPGRRRRGKNSV